MIKKPTIKDIAKVVGVSTTTISRYINGKFDNMSEETKDRINKVIIELDYEPSSIARTLKTHKSGMIGLVISDVLKPFCSMLYKGINDVCIEEGYQLMIANSNNNKFDEKKYLKTMKEYNFEGIIINHTGENLDFLLDLNNEGTKLVSVNNRIDNRNIDSVTTNNREIMQKVTKSLLEKGYEDIWFVAEKEISNNFINDIYLGFKLGYQEHFNDYDKRIITFAMVNIENQLKCIYDNYKKKKIAIFCENGIVLLQTIKYLKSMNVNIPEDIGILGFDDMDWCDTLEKDITVIKQPIYKVGREAAKLLIDRITCNSNVHEATHIILKNSYEERSSTEIVK